MHGCVGASNFCSVFGVARFSSTSSSRGNCSRHCRFDLTECFRRQTFVLLIAHVAGMVQRMSTSSPPQSRSSSYIGAFGWFFRNAISLLFTAAAVAGVYNVYGVAVEVETLAKTTACQGKPLPCNAQFNGWERTPWAHSFQLQTSTGLRPIWCQRQYILVGDWACRFKDQIAEPIPSGYPSAFVKVKPVPAPAKPARTVPASSASSATKPAATP